MLFTLDATHVCETWDGEPITGMREFNGKLYVFTKSAVYQLREMRWYEKLWLRLRGMFRRA